MTPEWNSTASTPNKARRRPRSVPRPSSPRPGTKRPGPVQLRLGNLLRAFAGHGCYLGQRSPLLRNDGCIEPEGVSRRLEQQVKVGLGVAHHPAEQRTVSHHVLGRWH